ncbi:hypothetical protein V6N13_092129 [Hibiscus sabdariffa]
MASPLWFISVVLSYVSFGVGVGFVSTLAAGLVMPDAASSLEFHPPRVGKLESGDSANGEMQPIPYTLGNVAHLKLLDLSHNLITGPIPSTLGYLANLTHCPTTLNLSHNFIHGHIPQHDEVTDFYQLYDLDLSYNNLSGMIPESLSSLGMLNLSYNSLEGPIPKLLSYSFSPYSFWGNKHLCGDVAGFLQCRKTSN